MGWILITLFTMNSMRANPIPWQGSRHQRKAAAGLAMFIMMRVRVSGISCKSISDSVKSRAPS